MDLSELKLGDYRWKFVFIVIPALAIRLIIIDRWKKTRTTSLSFFISSRCGSAIIKFFFLAVVLGSDHLGSTDHMVAVLGLFSIKMVIKVLVMLVLIAPIDKLQVSSIDRMVWKFSSVRWMMIVDMSGDFLILVLQHQFFFFLYILNICDACCLCLVKLMLALIDVKISFLKQTWWIQFLFRQLMVMLTFAIFV